MVKLFAKKINVVFFKAAFCNLFVHVKPHLAALANFSDIWPFILVCPSADQSVCKAFEINHSF